MDAFLEANKWLERADHLLVIAHVSPDGDAISSTLAMGEMLKQLGKSYTLANESPIPSKFSFLPGVDQIQLADEIEKTFQYVIALDCGDQSRLGTGKDLLSDDAEILNIDHHHTNDRFGDVNLVDPHAAATVQILYRWIVSHRLEWTSSLLMQIYTGLLTDTGGFRYANTSAEVLRQAADLIEAGVPAPQIADVVLETVSIEQLQLLQIALRTLTTSTDGLVAWMTLNLADYEHLSTKTDAYDGIVNYARNIMGVDVGILYREVEGESVKVSLRSRAIVDVGQVAQDLGGGGHARAAGVTLSGSLAEVTKLVLSRIEAELE
ncbi:DHH family phosphoesterase [Hazenella sp. IB182357]|uniref:DHH family phosphoesterase n=1 Tax=Polycladospora coralii TaxID=2771432 RepID=A0A926NDM6_9BACL|nr:DHH family phosphoesterase [Polycladospora coralii]MBD1373475.1 DHH family phosphoesterase [Polycladospora coralii]